MNAHTSLNGDTVMDDPGTEQILANIKALGPELAERAKEFDQLRRIPSDVYRLVSVPITPH
ncbi:hypothetical protein [Phyllobacterium sophorae]|uniref:Uncharacterized protein n=1 Tax=Phyllobacterium sophorae TaxID=1520277 RepID=A0A2P7B6N1_9HYPH|nr:hypothetical protein [Phyllobacterium sophorae]PSH62122.1 hypothetical protein CU103_19970 [Phyllobacterium sophorae]